MDSPGKVVVAGGSGALGRRVCDDLADLGLAVVVLTRSPGRGRHRQVGWDGRSVGPWAHELEDAAVVNLAGELVDRRPSPAGVALLTSSRVGPTRALADAAAGLDRPVPVWVQASTLALHGDAGETVLTEASPAADGPPQMAGVTRVWEDAAAGVHAARQVVLRTGIVLDRGTPALDRLTGLVRWGLGGRVGSGRQWVSWVHVEDWLRIVRWSLGVTGPGGAGLPAGPAPSGPLVASGPHPVRNTDLMRALRRTLRRPPAPPTPPALVRLGAVLLRTDPLLALSGRRATSSVLADAGFVWAHPDLDEALEDLLHWRRS